MASQADIKRARSAVRQGLQGLEALKQTLEACSDRPLRLVLGGISRRKAGHASRLLDWLQGRSPGLALDLDALRADQRPEAAAPDGLGPAIPAAGVEGATTGSRQTALKRRDVTADLVVFKIPRPADFSFIAGQSVKLRLNGVKRSYSIVSAPHEPFLEFFIELVPGGQMSERLRTLTQGGLLNLEPRPKGNLIFDDRFPNHLMAATVTGVNPFISILRDYLHKGRRGHRFYLLHGASYQDEFGYKDELQRLAAEHPDILSYIPTVSRPDEPRNAGWTGERGRVDAIIDKYLNQFGLDNRSTMLYACGNPGMVDEVERRYRPLGFEIKTERYD